MNDTEIRKYAELMKELDLTGLEITDENRKVRLERSASEPAKEIIYPFSGALMHSEGNGNSAVFNPAAAGTSFETAGTASAADTAANTASSDTISICSPLVGVFYAAPAENAEPYVSIGDKVKKGQIVCIIEAMKLMNEIPAAEDGVITEICVTDGQVVEYGTELFRIRK